MANLPPSASSGRPLAHCDTEPLLPTLALRPRQAARALSISERLLWSKTNAGEIPHMRIGRSILYPVGPLEKWLAEQVQVKGGRT